MGISYNGVLINGFELSFEELESFAHKECDKKGLVFKDEFGEIPGFVYEYKLENDKFEFIYTHPYYDADDAMCRYFICLKEKPDMLDDESIAKYRKDIEELREFVEKNFGDEKKELIQNMAVEDVL